MSIDPGRFEVGIDYERFPQLDDAIVSAREGQSQKPLRVEHGQRHLGERLLERRDGHFRGPGTVSVPAHAVHHDHQQGVASHDQIDSILVLRPIAGQSQFCMFNAHA